MSKVAVYPGTFDPVTNGHLDLARRGASHFDRLIISVLSHDAKQPVFTVDERMEFLREAVQGLENVDVGSFDGLLVDYADQVGATIILRGIRVVTDLEYEMQLAMMNRRLRDGLETVFLVPSEKYSYVSSRLVREVASLGGSVDGLVPPGVVEALKRRFPRRPST